MRSRLRALLSWGFLAWGLVALGHAVGPPVALAASQAPAVEEVGSYRFPSGEAVARRFTLGLEGPPVEVWLPLALPEARAARLLGTLAGYLAQLPAAHRTALASVAFDPGEYPANSRKARQLGQPAIKLWASARAGLIVFYRNTPPGDWRVSRRRVFHEMGHCLAHSRFGSSTPPGAWAEAVHADAAFFSDYSRRAFEATGTLVEDFADAYATYMQAIVDGGEPLAAFRASYPARARLLEAYTRE